MLGSICIAVGAVLMTIGVVMLSGWSGGSGRWFGRDGRGPSRTNWLIMDLYFLAKVVCPLFVGAVLILYGLRQLV